MKRKAAVMGLILLLAAVCPFQAMAGSEIQIEPSKKYEGMECSFSKGYEPSVKGNTMILVIPFKSEEEFKDDEILVGIDFEKEEDSPFYVKNYQKQVRKSKDGIYLYRCSIKLKKERRNGQYPLKLRVQAQTSEKWIEQEFVIYAEITDGEQNPGNPGNEEGNPGLEGQDSGAPGIGNQDPGMGDTASENQETADSEGKKTHQPRILVQNGLTGNGIEAGSSVMWNVTAKNYGGQAVENMKVTLLTENTNLLFEKNSWYFDHKGAGDIMDLSQNVSAVKKAAPQPVPLQFQFEYEDKDGTSYTATETVNLSVIQPQQAELANLSFPESVYASDTNPLTFQIQNTGLSVIYNVKVRMEGKGLFPGKELFLGNVEAGTSVDGEIPVFAGSLDMDEKGEASKTEEKKKYGETEGTVLFSYEDENGNVQEQRQTLHTRIEKPQTVELKVEKPKPQTNQWWITIAAGIVLVLALAVVWLYLRMRQYKKRVEFHEKP